MSSVLGIETRTTNIIISDRSERTQIEHQSSCYVPNIKLITNKCNSYSICNPSAIITTGVIKGNDNKLSLFNQDCDICCAAIFDDKYLNDGNTQNIFGFEVELASFNSSICDDILYSPHKQSIIAYQSFDSKFNKLYYLNKSVSSWNLLGRINWRKSASPASMMNINGNKELFISTNSGESVVMNLSDNKWKRLPQLDVKEYSFDEIPILPHRPVFAYNEEFKIMYRLNKNCDSNHCLDLNQMRWIKMPLNNAMNNEIQHQRLWLNDASPNILYTMIYKYCRKRCKNMRKVVYGYYDERDSTQKQWKVVSCSKTKQNSNLFNSQHDLTASVF